MSLVRDTVRWSILSLGLILAISIPVAGWRGGVGGALGVLLTDLDLISLGLFSNVLVNQSPGVRTFQLCLTVIFMKLPVLTAAAWLAVWLGTPALVCFIGGIALVYFALVHVAIRGADSRQQDPFS